MNCPHCNNLTSPTMKKCVHCGKDIDNRAIRDSSESIDCPTCNIKSDIVSFADIELDVCQQCGGVWFDKSEIEKWQKAVINQALADEAKQTFQKLASQNYKTERAFYYLDCPICGEKMRHCNFMDVSGIMLDTCVDDGVWVKRDDILRLIEIFNSGEINEFIRRSEASKKYREEQQQLEQHLEIAKLKQLNIDDHSMEEADTPTMPVNLLLSLAWILRWL